MSRDPSVALARALARSAEAAGTKVKLLSMSARGWTSATFNGARHRLTFTAKPSAALEEWLASLRKVDLPIPGQLLADLTVRSAGRLVELDALTVQDAR